MATILPLATIIPVTCIYFIRQIKLILSDSSLTIISDLSTVDQWISGFRSHNGLAHCPRGFFRSMTYYLTNPISHIHSLPQGIAPVSPHWLPTARAPSTLRQCRLRAYFSIPMDHPDYPDTRRQLPYTYRLHHLSTPDQSQAPHNYLQEPFPLVIDRSSRPRVGPC